MEFEICETQQKVYELAVKKGYDMKTFSAAYLQSGFCKRAFDTIYSRFQIADAEEIFDFLIPEISEKLKLGKSDSDVYAGDAGFMYRLLYIMTSIPSSKLSEIIPYDVMTKKAPVFDHYGFDNCAVDIIEEYHLPYKQYDTDYESLTEQEMKEIEKKYGNCQ